jgi:hypothetical protein
LTRRAPFAAERFASTDFVRLAVEPFPLPFAGRVGIVVSWSPEIGVAESLCRGQSRGQQRKTATTHRVGYL